MPVSCRSPVWHDVRKGEPESLGELLSLRSRTPTSTGSSRLRFLRLRPSSSTATCSPRRPRRGRGSALQRRRRTQRVFRCFGKQALDTYTAALKAEPNYAVGLALPRRRSGGGIGLTRTRRLRSFDWSTSKAPVLRTRSLSLPKP